MGDGCTGAPKANPQRFLRESINSYDVAFQNTQCDKAPSAANSVLLASLIRALQRGRFAVFRSRKKVARP